jgi:hypothetical protein
MFTKATFLTTLLAVLFGSASPAQAKTPPDSAVVPVACRAYANLLSTPEVAGWYRTHMPDAMPDELRTVSGDALRTKLLALMSTESEEGCSRSMTRRLAMLQERAPEFDQIIAGMLPQACHGYRASFNDGMQERVRGDQSKLTNAQHQRDSRLLQLQASDENAVADYCAFAAALWNNADDLSEHDFDATKQKYALPEVCDAAYDKLKEEAFGAVPKTFGAIWVRATMKRSLPFLLDNRAYMSLRYSQQPDALLEVCKKQLQL